MNWKKAYDIEWYTEYLNGGIRFYPYKISFGITFDYWACLPTPYVALYILNFKIWLYINPKGRNNAKNKSISKG